MARRKPSPHSFHSVVSATVLFTAVALHATFVLELLASCARCSRSRLAFAVVVDAAIVDDAPVEHKRRDIDGHYDALLRRDRVRRRAAAWREQVGQSDVDEGWRMESRQRRGRRLLRDRERSSTKIMSDAGGTPPQYGVDDDPNAELVISTPSTRRSLSAAGCGTKGWHPEVQSGKQDGCSNDKHYPAEWASEPSLSEIMFYPSSAACCDFLKNMLGTDCKVYECSEGTGGGGAGEGGGGVPAPEPTSKDCAWHADITSGEESPSCTNDDNYPQEWLEPDLKIFVFWKTPEECCDSLFGGEACRGIDRGCSVNVLGGGDDTTPPPKRDCVTPGWHPDMTKKDGCTNGEDYPATWLNSDQFSFMFHPSAQACCDALASSLPRCRIYDVGCTIDTSIGCDPNVWHPDQSTADGGGCTNSLSYPTDWKGKNGEFMFSSAEACCNKWHMNGNCAARDQCTNQVKQVQVTLKPTARPTKMPTPPPTKYPTRYPTLAPLDPTGSPTITGFYIVHGVGICNDGVLFPKPHYVTETYADLKRCCQAAWPYYPLTREECLAPLAWYQPDEPTAVPAPTRLPTPAPIADAIVDITSFGSLMLQNVKVPEGYVSSPKWSALIGTLIKTIMMVIAESPIAHPGLKIELSTIGMIPFPRSSRKLQGEGSADVESEENVGGDWIMHGFTSPREDWEGRRAATESQQLTFTMTVPTRCDIFCQGAGGFLGKLAFDELEDHFQHRIEDGTFSLRLEAIGLASGVFVRGDHPIVTSGTLSYRLGTPSSITWVPTFNPTVLMPTMFPTSGPTVSPTEEVTMPPTPVPTTGTPTSSPTTACSALKWHYSGDGECTNDQSYPELWDRNPTVGMHFLFGTPEECCLARSPERCIITDTCDEGTYLAEAVMCGNQAERTGLYHPTTPDLRMCTNDMDYPPAWDHSDKQFLFESADDCCVAFYNDGLCLIRNSCK